jgi:hypothetical protein
MDLQNREWLIRDSRVVISVELSLG